MDLENYRNEAFVALCHESLKNYTQRYRGIDAALLATPEGFEVASYSIKNNGGSGNRLVAVGSSLYSLSTSLIGDFELKNCKSVILDSENGKIHISCICSAKGSMILMVQTSQQAILGDVIHGIKQLSEAIASHLSEIE